MSGHLPPIHPSAPSLPYPPPSYEPASGHATASPRSPAGGGHHGNYPGGLRSGDGRLYPGHGPVPPMADGLPRYGGEYEMGSPALDPLRMGHRMDHMMPGGPHLAHQHPGHLQAHKRAYRQRRKDPSCDACRERKVKCDATDTSSCSECSSRNVKCQFTKETNRRMSSLKQVQDLEKQLLVAKQQVSHYRSMANGDPVAIEDGDTSPGGSSPTKRRKLSHHNYVSIQTTMQERGGGLLQGPRADEESSRPPAPPGPAPKPPPRHVTDQLVRKYESSLHALLPFLHWPMVLQLVDRVYRDESLKNVPSDSAALFFGVLACGALADGVEDAQPHFESLRQLLDFWTETPSLNLVRASLLGTIYLAESNQRRHAFALAGYAVRIAQDMGLHRRTEMFSLNELDLRQRLWSATVWIERMLSLELGRPSMLPEDELAVVEGRSVASSPTIPRHNDPMEPMVQVAAVAPQIQKVFRASVAPTMTLATIDERLLRLLAPYARESELAPNQPPSQHSMWMTIIIYATQLIVHRHNFSPASPAEIKQGALECCKTVASETARLLLRLDDNPEIPIGNAGQTSRFSEMARQGLTTLLILHLWRSTLHLVYAFDFEGAQICARFLSQLGNLRPINRSCGRYLEFFTEALRQKLRQGRPNFLEDKELVAFVSADLQNNLDQAWIWTGADRNSPRSMNASYETSRGASAENSDWDNWNGVIASIQELADESGRGTARFVDPNHSIGPAPPLPPPPSSSKVSSRPNTAATSASTVSPVSGNNRVSIADLMG